MPVTYKQIAEIVGVSRGTVDRALNDRGRIDPDVKRRIQQVAKELGFQPSHIGRALARAKNPVKIGVIVHLTKIPFFQQVIQGIRQARTDIANLGGELLIEEFPSLDAKMQIKSLDILIRQGVQALAISPAQDEELKDRLNELYETKGLPIITFNTDMEDLKRMCYVGLDNIKAGRTSAGLMNLLLKELGGKVLIISGHSNNRANLQRTEGFIQEVGSQFTNIEIVDRRYNEDDDDKAYGITMTAVKEIRELAAIYMVSSGQAGVCRALEETGNAGRVKLIVYDTLPDTVEYIQKDVIDFIIDQNAFAQGNRPPHILFNFLFNGQPVEEENIFTDINIKTKYNI